MARLSKAQHFEVYDDSTSSTSTPILEQAVHKAMHSQSKSHLGRPELERQDSKYDVMASLGLAVQEDADFLTVDEDENDAYADDERRESVMTSTSISSMPDSVICTDHELPYAMHRPYTPPSARPMFRRAESVRRMQMTSPTPFDRSPRRSVLTRSRPGTPRSARSGIKSPKAKKRIEEDEDAEEERREYPLVLLHLTLLPVDLPWSADSMQNILPTNVQDNLALLRAKVSETILQRGILIPHPREDYELLEERLLEALELKTERVTKCGHFRARGSTSTISSDSGHGSSLEGSDSEVCLTCCHQVKTSRSGVVGSANQRWTVKVFAANGLMRAAAWAAAWPEMERVDVEILPWISDDLRRILDARAADEEAAERERAEEEASFAKPAAGELTWIADGDVTEMTQAEALHGAQPSESLVAAELLARIATAAGRYSTSSIPEPALEQDQPAKTPSDLPPIYRPSEIPLSLLLRNYVFLLAQDARNVAIFALTVIAVWLSIQSAMQPALRTMTLPQPVELCSPPEAPKANDLNATLDFATPAASFAANVSVLESTAADTSMLGEAAVTEDPESA